MASIHPTKIPGRWREGFALDFHTLSSTFVGDDEYGHPVFETTRTELGELLLRLKYRADASVVAEIVDLAASFTRRWNPGVEVIVPVPPSRARAQQPVLMLAQALAVQLEISVDPGCVTRAREVPELKNVYEYDQRVRLLQGAHVVKQSVVGGRKVLLLDDLFRSGATMNAITGALYDQGHAADVYALTITRTRSRT